MDPDSAAAGDGHAQLPEHATVAVASAPPLYLPASQLAQVEAPASEYLPARMRPSQSAHPQLLPMPARVTPWHLGCAGVRWGTGKRGLPAGHDEQVDDAFAPTANEYVPATSSSPSAHPQLPQCRRLAPHGTLLGCGRARGEGLRGFPAGHREQNVSQFPTKPA